MACFFEVPGLRILNVSNHKSSQYDEIYLAVEIHTSLVGECVCITGFVHNKMQMDTLNRDSVSMISSVKIFFILISSFGKEVTAKVDVIHKGRQNQSSLSTETRLGFLV